jgi:hypothetical protein
MLTEMISMNVQLAPMLALAALLALLSRGSFNLRWLLVAILLIYLHNAFLTNFLWQVKQPEEWGKWNWLGKFLALGFILAVACLPGFGLRRSGITLRQAPGSRIAWLVTLALCLFFLALAIFTGDGRPSDPDHIAFQWTMPGLEEEALYRGILLLALNEAFSARRRILGADMGWGALLSSLMFGAVHGLSYEDGAIGVEPFAFAATFVSALILVWLRERTGSIAAPIVGHNVGNGVFTLF